MEQPYHIKDELQLGKCEKKYKELIEHLKDLNDKTFTFDEILCQKRPKHEIFFYKRKQNMMKEQLKKELATYEHKMKKIREDM